MMRFILTFETVNGKKEFRFYKTLEETQNAIEFLRKTRKGEFYNFKIKPIKMS